METSLIHQVMLLHHVAGLLVAEFFFSYHSLGLWSLFGGRDSSGLDMMTLWPNHALQRTRRGRRGCNRGVPRAGSLSLGR